MTKHRIPHRGDVYLIKPNPQVGSEMRDGHRFVVITPKAINQLGIAMTVPVTTSGLFSRARGLVVPIMGDDTTGVVICNQVRSFDIEERVRMGSARYIETLEEALVSEIVNRVLSVIDPAQE